MVSRADREPSLDGVDADIASGATRPLVGTALVDRISLPDGHLSADIRLCTDAHGLTHIYAGDERDLYFGQGFNAARERLWQIDLWRRRGLGLLAEAFGYGFVAQDRATRSFLYPGDVEAEWAACPAGAEEACQRFCEGINAYIQLIDEGRCPLPPEFTLLNIRPLRWVKEDVVVVRSNALSANAVSELRRSSLFDRGRHAADALRAVIQPPVAEKQPDPLIADCDALICLLELARAPVVITRERLSATSAEIENWADPKRFMASPDEAAAGSACEGSNNWALSGAKTATGYPILANDPHRALQSPSLRHAVHLSCPAFSVIGAGEPALPGISIGHNGEVAYGLTICPVDQEDVFCFERDEEGDGASTSLVARTCTIQVKGGETIEFVAYRFGSSPVLRLAEDGRSGVALRTVWSEPGAAPYLGGLALARAESVADFRSRLRTWRLPAVNFVAADTAGAIGWFVAGAVPRRATGSGILPTRSHSDPWDGFVPYDRLPSSIDPACAYVMSANEYNMPEGWSVASSALAHEWYEPYRARRIHEVLADTASATVEDSVRLQNDALSVAARDLQKLVCDAVAGGPHGGLGDHVRRFLDWDCILKHGAEQAQDYRRWLDVLKPRLLALVDPCAEEPVEVSTEALVLALRALPEAERADILLDTLSDAARTRGNHPAPPTGAVFRHSIQDGLAPTSFGHGPVAWDGDDATVHLGRIAHGTGLIESGASFRLVLDLADWDGSRWQNRPHTDVGRAENQMLPLLYSPEAVAGAMTSELRLTCSDEENAP